LQAIEYMVSIKKIYIFNIKIKYFLLETSIPDIAIEHRGYLYTQDQSSSITCRSKNDLYSIQPINIDQGCMTYFKYKNSFSKFVFQGNIGRKIL